MIDTSYLNLKTIIEQVAGVSLRGPNGTGEKRAYNGSCPFCNLGTDRFAVFQDCEIPHFHCGVHGNGCGAHGDAIKFVMLYNKCSFTEACEYLQEHWGLSLDGVSLPRPARAQETKEDTAPCDAWQRRAIAVVQEAVTFLWSDSEVARRALAYLKKRGLTEETIKRARLGYIVTERYELRSDWGLKDVDNGKDKPTTKLFIPRGWLIPWVIDKNLWRVDIRRHPDDIDAAHLLVLLSKNGPLSTSELAEIDNMDEKRVIRLLAMLTSAKKTILEQGKYKCLVKNPKEVNKYHRLAGSSDGLYGVNAIRQDQPLFVVESPLDALTGQQETPYVFVATGSTSGARNDPRWCAAMGVAAPVLFPFDADSAGNKAFEHWRETDVKPFRWLPWKHDVNEMLQAGMDIQDWASDGIETASLLVQASAHHSVNDVTKIRDDDTKKASELETESVTETCYESCYESLDFDAGCCLLCHTRLDEHDANAWRFSDDGYPFCLACWDARNLANASKAYPYLNARGLTTDLAERLASWLASAACIGCGSQDWVIDYDGLLVCPCVQARRDENRRLDREMIQEEKRRYQERWKAA